MKTDIDLRDAVLSELRFERSIGVHQIEVDVDNGFVTLTGTVGGPEQRAAAERAAQRVTGTVGVNCEIRIDRSDGAVLRPN